LYNKIKTFLEKRAEILLADMKGQWDERGGRILLGGNTGGGAVMREPIRFKRVAAWNLTLFPYIYIYIRIHLTIRRLNSNSRWTYRNVTAAAVGVWLSKHHSFCEAAFPVLLVNVDEI